MILYDIQNKQEQRIIILLQYENVFVALINAKWIHLAENKNRIDIFFTRIILMNIIKYFSNRKMLILIYKFAI